ncbi:uncharacterized protein AB675_3784 [Cyphellophora attinorum]|uniref:Letm1 RBD domain-containing protein n=1 Tax=Cyphellophora attinorum TaxID=1664694 RepID=A0A0N0NHZ5_9EURO|nr:uncharacterized protein AB675_3784 [Phialophora attinorum]KPI35251.1 hypothetical protein AB675_3784 [Phialophora attinorum]
MSAAVLRRRLLRPFQNGDLCGNCASHQVRASLRRQDNRRRTIQAVTLSTSGQRRDIEHAKWRKQIVSTLNDKEGEIRVTQHSEPSRKDGVLRAELYSDKPIYSPINIDPLPKPDKSVPKESTTLVSTRPPPFFSAKRGASEGRFTYLVRVGKTYYAFYKAGLKQLWSNRKELKELQAWMFPFTIEGVARYGGTMYKNKQGNNIPIPHIYHREFQLYHRTKADLRKMIPFSLLLLICGEFTPIALLVLGRKVVPKVCYLPFQQREEMDDILGRFRTWKREMGQLTARSRPEKPRNVFDFAPKTGLLEHPYRRDLLFAHLSGQTNFYRLPFPIMRGLYWHLVLRPRLNRFWENVFCETILVERQGGFKSMSPQDIYEYARNYGSLTLMVIMEKEVGVKKNYHFVDDKLKALLVPVLEKEAQIMLDDDFTKLPPALHWARAYRDSARWAGSPDVMEAARLKKIYEKEGVATASPNPTKSLPNTIPAKPASHSTKSTSKPTKPTSKLAIKQ